MKLTRKLSLAISLGICLVLAGHGWTRITVDRDTYRSDVRRDHAVLGRSLATVVELLFKEEGAARALAAVENHNMRTSNVTIRWVTEDDADVNDTPRRRDLVPRGAGDTRSAVVTGEDGVPHMLTYVRANVPRERAAIELYESLAHEREFQKRSLVRTAMTTAILIVLCAAITLAFGTFFVARPMRLLVGKAERIGAGDLGAPIVLTQNDEIRDLAGALNELTDKLGEARERESKAVEARIAMLEQLRHADRLRTLGELASGIAHELGTPLNVVRARGSMIASGEVPEPRMRALGAVVVEQVDKITVTIRQLLDYARRAPSDRRDTDLEQLMDATLHMLAPMAQKAGVTFTQERSDAPVVTHVDPGQMKQVLVNLIMNALQASVPGSNVSVRVQAVDGHAVTIIEDEGVGMAPEVLARVFEPFFTTKRAGEGTGLGLAIAEEIVRDHEGTLTLSSEEGRGTRAVVRLRRAG